MKSTKSRGLQALVLALVLAGLFMFRHHLLHPDVEPLSMETYEKLKKTLYGGGGGTAQISTVTMLSSDGSHFSGTLVRSGDMHIVITSAHSFSKHKPNASYEYLLDGQKHSVGSVFSHPKPGTFGGRDIAFCMPGKLRKIKHFWEWPTDTRFKLERVSKREPFQVLLLRGKKTLVLKAALWSDGHEAVYAIDYECVDGESGSGLMAKGVFFVIRGNLKDGGRALAEELGMSHITLVSEL